MSRGNRTAERTALRTWRSTRTCRSRSSVARAVRAAALVAIAAAIAVLWIFPIVAFPHPSTNDAIELSDLELPVLGIGFVALVVLLIRLPRSASVIRIGLG